MSKRFRRFFASSDFKVLKEILFLFTGWKIIISLIGFLGLSFLPQITESGNISWANINTDYWLKWANWDGGHFKGIAENGYLHSFQVVFFPLYPLLTKALMVFGISSLWSGLIISNISLIGGLFFLYKLVRLDFEDKIARKTILLLLAFPTAFYLSAFYSESLFLFLSVAAVYYARVNRFSLSLILAGLSAATRFAGLTVILIVAIEYFLINPRLPPLKQFWSEFINRIACYILFLGFISTLSHDLLVSSQLFMQAGLSRSLAVFLTLLSLILFSVSIVKFLYKEMAYKKVSSITTFIFILSFIPFLSYCLFLYSTQDNFLAFMSHEQKWARHLTLPWNAPINYIKDLINFGAYSINYVAQRVLEFIFFILFFGLLVVGYFKLRFSYFIYFALSLLIPISTGTFQAIHRYGLVIFPIFILLALIKDELKEYLWFVFSISLLGVLTVLFINRYWVS